MIGIRTTELLSIQPFCSSAVAESFVAFGAMMPIDPQEAGAWLSEERVKRGLSAANLAARINGIAQEQGDPTRVSQQVVSKFEQSKNKRMPAWTRYAFEALEVSDLETKEDPHLTMALSDDSVQVRQLPTFVGLGAGGTGDDDAGTVSFSRDLIERELRVDPQYLLAMVAEGDSMQPEFFGGDQILVDTRRKSLAQPGSFCLWDGDGHVIKKLEKIPGTEPLRVRVISLNSTYSTHERLVDEINLVGRVIWYGRKVQ